MPNIIWKAGKSANAVRMSAVASLALIMQIDVVKSIEVIVIYIKLYYWYSSFTMFSEGTWHLFLDSLQKNSKSLLLTSLRMIIPECLNIKLY